MPQVRSIVLVAPRLLQDLERARTNGENRWPALARLAGRGVVKSTRVQPDRDPWSGSLLAALGIEGEGRRYPSAALLGCAVAGPTGDYWLEATAMNFTAGIKHVIATPLSGERGMSSSEAERLTETLAPHLKTAGFEIAHTNQNTWLLRSKRSYDLKSATPSGAARNLEEAMPTGEAAPLMKRLMTELQMLLHEHPVNVARARAGLPEINAVWLHGGGSIVASEPRVLPEAFGDDLYLRGFYRAHDLQAQEAAADAEDLLKRMSGAAIAVLGLETLDELERLWLAPLFEALRARSIGALDLVIDHWRIALDYRGSRRFWRRALPPARWPA